MPLAIDNIVESEEEFELRIDRASLAVLISADPTRVVIVDNDSEFYQGVYSVYLRIHMSNMIHFIAAATVSFVQSTYSVNETDELVQVGMVLSDPSSTDITVQVASSDLKATSKH